MPKKKKEAVVRELVRSGFKFKSKDTRIRIGRETFHFGNLDDAIGNMLVDYDVRNAELLTFKTETKKLT